MADATFTSLDPSAAKASDLRGYVAPTSQNVFIFGRLTGPNPYATGGFVLPNTLLRMMRHPSNVFFQDNGVDFCIWRWNSTTSKVEIYTALGTEATDSSDQSDAAADVIVVGTEL